VSGRDAEHGGGAADGPAELARQLRAAADQIMTAAAPVIPAMPAARSTRQVQAVLEDLAARRAQVQALRSRLEAFDEQLGALEASLRPVLDWTRTWADVENALTRFWGLADPARPSAGHR
jgi:hypothetical protein